MTESINVSNEIKENTKIRQDSQETIINNNSLEERVGPNNASNPNETKRSKDSSTCPSRREETKESSRHKPLEKKKRRSRSRDRSRKDRRHSSSASRSNSYSRSRSRSRSRSKRRHDRRRRRSRSRDYKRRSYRRDRDEKSRRHRRRSRSASSRGRSRSSSSSRSSSRVKNRPAKVIDYRELRRRNRDLSRSNSALRVMKLKNLENSCGYFQRFYERPHEDNDPNKPQLYWDGFQWVIKPNSLSTQTFDVIKPGRKVQIANIPLHLNITAIDLKNYLIKKVNEKNIITKNDVENINNIIRGLEIDFDKNAAVIALESTDLAKRIVLLDGITLLGHTLRFSAYQDVSTGDTTSSAITKSSALANSAQLSAKSAAIAFAAFKSISKNDSNVSINLSNSNKLAITRSRVVKVMNLVDPDAALKLKSEKFDELGKDIRDEFKRFGEIKILLVIRPNLVKIGAECGSCFVEFAELASAEAAIKRERRRYCGRDIKTSYIDEEAFRKEILEDENQENK